MITSRRDFLALAIAPLMILLDVPEVELPAPAPAPSRPVWMWRVTHELRRGGCVREIRHEDFRTEREAREAFTLITLMGTPEGFDFDAVTYSKL